MFGLFRRKPKNSIPLRFEISMETRTVEISEQEMQLRRQGWKKDNDGTMRPPDTVWITRNGEVYHRFPYCTGPGNFDRPKIMTEQLAIQRGYRKCARCDWKRISQFE